MCRTRFGLILLVAMVSGCAAAARPDAFTVGPSASADEIGRYLESRGIAISRRPGGAPVIPNTRPAQDALLEYLGFLDVAMQTVAENLANAETVGPEGPYCRRLAQVDAAGKVTTTLDAAPFRVLYEPDHPFADANGCVRFSNVRVELERVECQVLAQRRVLVCRILRKMDGNFIGGY